MLHVARRLSQEGLDATDLAFLHRPEANKGGASIEHCPLTTNRKHGLDRFDRAGPTDIPGDRLIRRDRRNTQDRNDGHHGEQFDERKGRSLRRVGRSGHHVCTSYE